MNTCGNSFLATAECDAVIEPRHAVHPSQSSQTPNGRRSHEAAACSDASASTGAESFTALVSTSISTVRPPGPRRVSAQIDVRRVR